MMVGRLLSFQSAPLFASVGFFLCGGGRFGMVYQGVVHTSYSNGIGKMMSSYQGSICPKSDTPGRQIDGWNPRQIYGFKKSGGRVGCLSLRQDMFFSPFFRDLGIHFCVPVNLHECHEFIGWGNSYLPSQFLGRRAAPYWPHSSLRESDFFYKSKSSSV